ncbi:unnamed protein product, partial [Phaeothamnion confervicola]
MDLVGGAASAAGWRMVIDEQAALVAAACVGGGGIAAEFNFTGLVGLDSALSGSPIVIAAAANLSTSLADNIAAAYDQLQSEIAAMGNITAEA